MSRPTTYTEEIAAEILERLADGESLIAICRDERMPSERTVRRWDTEDIEGFAPKYARARNSWLDHMAEDLIEIADDGSRDYKPVCEGDETVYVPDHDHINRSKLRVDARKWLTAKLAPKRYGDKLDLNHSGTVNLAGLLGSLDGDK